MNYYRLAAWTFIAVFTVAFWAVVLQLLVKAARLLS